MFVRTAGCDYHCDWCDSAFTWDGSEKPTRMTADEVIAALDKLGSYDYVTLSGGNPAILAANMAELVTKLKERWCHPCCRDSRFSLAKLVKRYRPDHSQPQTSFIQDGSQL